MRDPDGYLIEVGQYTPAAIEGLQVSTTDPILLLTMPQLLSSIQQ